MGEVVFDVMGVVSWTSGLAHGENIVDRHRDGVWRWATVVRRPQKNFRYQAHIVTKAWLDGEMTCSDLELQPRSTFVALRVAMSFFILCFLRGES